MRRAAMCETGLTFANNGGGAARWVHGARLLSRRVATFVIRRERGEVFLAI